jgi:hypothetical protein
MIQYYLLKDTYSEAFRLLRLNQNGVAEVAAGLLAGYRNPSHLNACSCL